MTTRDCHHGEHARTCYRCELEARVAELEAAVREALKRLDPESLVAVASTRTTGAMRIYDVARVLRAALGEE